MVALIVNSSDLGERRVDPAMVGNGLVLADHAQRKAEARARDQPAQQEHRDGEQEQLPVDVALGDVDEDIAAEHARFVDLEPDHELADQLRQAEREDDEIDAAQPQRREADDGGQNGAECRCDQQHQRPWQDFAEHGHRVGADAEERRRRQRDIAGGSGEHPPGGRQHGVLQEADGQREVVGIAKARHEGQQRKGCERKRAEDCGSRAHRVALPNRPAGLTSNTARNSAKLTASVSPGST